MRPATVLVNSPSKHRQKSQPAAERQELVGIKGRFHAVFEIFFEKARYFKKFFREWTRIGEHLFRFFF